MLKVRRFTSWLIDWSVFIIDASKLSHVAMQVAILGVQSYILLEQVTADLVYKILPKSKLTILLGSIPSVKISSA